jgi:hypothetical protein
VFCCGLGYMINIMINPHLPGADFNLLVAFCGPFIFLIFGGTSWAVYFIMHKRKSKLAVLASMLVFTLLVAAPIAASSLNFVEKMRDRNEYMHLHALREKYIRFCTREIKSHPSMTGIDSTNDKTKDFCYCVFEKMENSGSLKKILLVTDEPKDLQKNNAVKLVERSCYDEYFSIKKP